jgi:hypothetical protein
MNQQREGGFFQLARDMMNINFKHLLEQPLARFSNWMEKKKTCCTSIGEANAYTWLSFDRLDSVAYMSKSGLCADCCEVRLNFIPV